METVRMHDIDIAAAADALETARGSGVRLRCLEGALAPSSPADAYAIQFETARRGGGIAGWKIAPGRQDGAAIARSAVVATPATLSSSLPLVVEVEIGIRFGKDLPARSEPYRLEEIFDAIDTVCPVIEVQASRYFEPKAIDPLHSLADTQNCLALVFGEGLKDWRQLEFAELEVWLEIDGTLVCKGPRGATSAAVFESLGWLVQHAADSCGGITDGTIVMTGARAGPVNVLPGSTIYGGVTGIGEASVLLRS